MFKIFIYYFYICSDGLRGLLRGPPRHQQDNNQPNRWVQEDHVEVAEGELGEGPGHSRRLNNAGCFFPINGQKYWENPWSVDFLRETDDRFAQGTKHKIYIKYPSSEQILYKQRNKENET